MDGAVIGTIVAALAGAVVSIYTVRQNAIAKKADTLQSQLARLGKRVEKLEQRDRIKDDYIAALRQAFQDETGHAPPRWPAELLALDPIDAS